MKWILAAVAASVLVMGCAQSPTDVSNLEGRWVADYDPKMQQMLDDSHGRVELQLEIKPESRYRLTSSAGDSELVNNGTVEVTAGGLVLRDDDNPDRKIVVEVQQNGTRLYLPSIRTGFVREK